jgi:hypothetical protein
MDKFSNELHKTALKKFPQRRVHTNGIDDIWSADLIDMSEWKKENNNYTFGLCVIDVFSKFACVIPTINKKGPTILEAFKKAMKIFDSRCTKLWVDQGSEFYNKQFEKFAKDNNFTLYSTYSINKAVVIERFNRTLKNKIWKHFTEEQTRNWVDVLDEIVNKYNNTKHSTIGMKPIQARKPVNEGKIMLFEKLREEIPKESKHKFKVGDMVRISRVKGTFEKGFLPNWSTEVFKIVKSLNTRPKTYKIEDYNGETLEGSFYAQELLKTEVPDIYLVEKILQTKTVHGQKQYLVKYLGWPDKFNSWVLEKDLQDLQNLS